jgi:hypothetical protein
VFVVHNQVFTTKLIIIYLGKRSNNSCLILRILIMNKGKGWSSLIQLIPEKKTMVGAPSWLPPEGYFGLMFLKHYLKLSDEKRLERFNTDWAIQMF